MIIAGKYDIVRELGRGAFGTVYEANDRVLDRRVAIKTISEAVAHTGSGHTLAERFLREARASGRLSHPNIVQVFDAGTSEGVSYLAMEFVDGESLRRMIAARGRLSSLEAMELMEQLLSALDYAHARGVVHRDIKPENLMVRGDGILKITDFGIAKIAQAAQSTLSREGFTAGTPSYMSPEQVLSKGVDGRSDLFSATAIFHEMVAGARAFEGESLPAVLYKVIGEPPPRTSAVAPVPMAIDDVVAKGLAKRPDDRFSSGAEMLEALRRALASPREPISVAPPAPAVPPAVPAAAPLEPGPRVTVTTEVISASGFLWMPVDLPDHADLSGSFDETAVAEVLLELGRKRESGLLVVESLEWLAGVDLRDGQVVGVSGGPPRTALAATLLRMGLVDEAGHQRLADEVRKAGGLSPEGQGSLAVRLGLLSGAQLLGVLEAQIDARLDAIVGVEKGKYRIYRGRQTGQWTQMPPRGLEPTVLAALRARPGLAGDLIARFLGRDGWRRVKARPDAGAILPRFRFPAKLQRLLNQADGRALSDLATASVADPIDVGLFVYLVWTVGGFEVVAVAAAPTLPVTPGSATAPPAARPHGPASSPVSSPPVPRAGSAPGSRAEDAPPSRRPPEPLPSRVAVRSAPPDPAREREAGALLETGARSVENRQFEAAVEVLRRAKDLSPQNPRILASLGWAVFRQQPGLEACREEAKTLFQASLALDPVSVSAIVNLARIHRFEDDLDMAQAYLIRALTLSPDSPDVKLEVEALARVRQRQAATADGTAGDDDGGKGKGFLPWR